MFNIDVDSSEVDGAITALITTAERNVENAIDGLMNAIAMSIEQVVLAALREGLEPGNYAAFMLDRTRVDVDRIPNGILVKVGGKTESEVGSSNTNAGGESPNLWVAQEFGAEVSSTDKWISFHKDDGTGQRVVAKGRAGYTISRHVGKVRNIIQALTVKLNATLAEAFEGVAVAAVGGTLKAGGAKVAMGDWLRGALGARGFGEGFLLDKGITRVTIGNNGQIVYMGKGGGNRVEFKPARVHNLPTRSSDL